MCMFLIIYLFTAILKANFRYFVISLECLRTPPAGGAAELDESSFTAFRIDIFLGFQSEYSNAIGGRLRKCKIPS